MTPQGITRAIGRGLLIAPLTIFFVTFLVAPLTLTLSAAFQRIDTATYEVTDHATLHQFFRFLGDEYYLGVMWATFRITALTTLFCVLLGYPYALAMWRARPAERQVLRLIALSPLLISFVIMNLGWLIILAPGGVINATLQSLGLIGQPLPLLYSSGAVIVGLVHVHLPFMILSIENALEGIRPELLRAGASLGSDPWRLFRHVIWPLSISGVVTGSTIVFATTASSFVTPVLLGGARVKTMASVAYQQILVTLDLPFGSAVALLLVLLTALVTLSVGAAAMRLIPHLRLIQQSRRG